MSDFASAEFSSTVGVRLRSKLLAADKSRMALSNFDSWVRANATVIETQSSDVHDADVMLRRLDLPLRAPDAIHIAISLRLGAGLATFDTRMAESARALGASLAAL